MTTVNIYLTFNDNCEEAFNFYKSVFGGEFLAFSKFSEMPEHPDYKVSEAEKERIMHVSLPISKETVLMGSDTSETFGKVTQGNNFSISVNAGTKEEATRIFNQLADGGKITMPLQDTFWGSYFGMCTDKFGINWMSSCELKQ